MLNLALILGGSHLRSATCKIILWTCMVFGIEQMNEVVVYIELKIFF